VTVAQAFSWQGTSVGAIEHEASTTLKEFASYDVVAT
jgi:hypothetical protein